jgi:hypothetical protein
MKSTYRNITAILSVLLAGALLTTPAVAQSGAYKQTTGRIRTMFSAPLPQQEIMSATANPDDPATCPPPTGDTSATGQQGTLCTFFKYVAGGLQPANRRVSLTPAFKTKYVSVKKDDQWTSTTYFECHYFDVSTNPATGQPFWTARAT